MEFLYKSHISTSTMIAVDSNSLLAERILSRNPKVQYFSEGYDSDLTSTSIVITFDNTQTVSRIALDGMNLKDFRIFYNGVTANVFALTSTADTTTANYTNNSDTAKFLACTPTACTSVTLQMNKTIAADAEKAVGYFYVGDLLLDFERTPSAGQYTPLIDSEEIVHKMSDGGTKINIKDRKRSTDLKLKNVSATFRDDLLEVYEMMDEFVYVAFPTATAWDKAMFPCVWEGDFNFFKHADNNPAAGFDGSIRLKETPA